MKELVIGVVVAVAYTLFVFFSGVVIGERLQQNDYLKGSQKNQLEAIKADARAKEKYPQEKGLIPWEKLCAK